MARILSSIEVQDPVPQPMPRPPGTDDRADHTASDLESKPGSAALGCGRGLGHGWSPGVVRPTVIEKRPKPLIPAAGKTRGMVARSSLTMAGKTGRPSDQ